MVTSLSSCDTKPVSNIVKLVLGKQITELNQNDIAYAMKFYYDCISLMKQGKINCPIASD